MEIISGFVETSMVLACIVRAFLFWNVLGLSEVETGDKKIVLEAIRQLLNLINCDQNQKMELGTIIGSFAFYRVADINLTRRYSGFCSNDCSKDGLERPILWKKSFGCGKSF